MLFLKAPQAVLTDANTHGDVWSFQLLSSLQNAFRDEEPACGQNSQSVFLLK